MENSTLKSLEDVLSVITSILLESVDQESRLNGTIGSQIELLKTLDFGIFFLMICLLSCLLLAALMKVLFDLKSVGSNCCNWKETIQI